MKSKTKLTQQEDRQSDDKEKKKMIRFLLNTLYQRRIEQLFPSVFRKKNEYTINESACNQEVLETYTFWAK